MANPVAVVTDSAACIPSDLLEKYNIRVVPLVVVWGEQSLADGVDIQPDEFYRRLQSAKIMPSTSQAPVGWFLKVYRELLDEGSDVLTVVISSKLSGTYQSAVQACEQLGAEGRVSIVDSLTTSMETGFHVLEAARAAASGASLEECRRVAEEAKKHTGVIFAVDTLEFLHRGGRIGGASRFLGTALGIKPILEIRDGKVEALEKVRTRRRSLERIANIVIERVGDRRPVRLAAVHANAPDDASFVLERASTALEPVETLISPVSPVIGTHTGPGTVGLAYMTGSLAP